MKKNCVILIILLMPFFCVASFDIQQWKYYKDIESSDLPDSLISFEPDEQIFQNSNIDLSDIRIVDQNNSEVPYKISQGKIENTQKSFKPKMLNNSFVPGKYSVVILDIGAESKLINQIKIDTNSTNFQRNVIISGSSDQKTWNILEKSGYIFDYTDHKGSAKVRNTTLEFPESNFRFMKLEISDPENKPVTISGVEVVYFSAEKVKKIERNPQYSISENADRKETEILIDSGPSGIPASQLAISASDKNFDRQVGVYSGNDKVSWKLLKTSYFFKYDTEKFTGINCSVDFPETNDKYIKVIIKNKDDQPLSIDAISTFYNYREILFQQENGNKYRIFYGNRSAKWPEYDFEKFFRYLNLENAASATLSAEKKNSFFAPPNEPEKPLSERIPYLITGAFILLAVSLISITFLFLRKK